MLAGWFIDWLVFLDRKNIIFQSYIVELYGKTNQNKKSFYL